MKVFFVLILVFLLFSCKQKRENNFTNISGDCVFEELQEFKKTDIFLKYKKDTFCSKGSQILFLLPSKKFFKGELENEEGIYEVDSDFGFYIDKTYKNLKNKYNFHFVTQRVLGVINLDNDTLFIDRYLNKIHYSTLLNSKKKKHSILEGIYTDEGFIREFELFYKD